MSADFTGGFWYEVSDEQLARFARMSERLKWVDAARLFTLGTRTPETTQRQERLRRGLPVVECLAPATTKRGTTRIIDAGAAARWLTRASPLRPHAS